ncbi:MAG: pyridoxal-dependent decarboxylase, exosortase A system-associated [Pseudomonadota bacterium]
MTRGSSLAHQRLQSLMADDGVLIVGGQALTAIAERAEGKPFFVYERAAVESRIAQLRAVLPSRVRLHYAVKANPLPELLKAIGALVDGFDVASAGELRAALAAGVSHSEIGFAGPGKTDDELREALDAKILISVESLNEASRVDAIAGQRGEMARVMARINPDFELRGAGMHMVGRPSPFGMGVDDGESLCRGEFRNLSFEGLHIYAGSQSLDAQAILEMNRATFELAAIFKQNTGCRFKRLNIGGGYGIPYFEHEQPLDLREVGAGLTELSKQYEELLEDVAIVIELGRYMVGEAGYYVSQIVDIKKSHGELFAVTNGGLHHHLANSGNFGQVVRKNFPVVIGNKMSAAPCSRATIVGLLCTPLDIIAKALSVPSLEVGDLVVVCQSGAYAHTASPQKFLSHHEALEFVV